jgi:hypothetical protein
MGQQAKIAGNYACYVETGAKNEAKNVQEAFIEAVKAFKNAGGVKEP